MNKKFKNEEEDEALIQFNKEKNLCRFSIRGYGMHLKKEEVVRLSRFLNDISNMMSNVVAKP